MDKIYKIKIEIYRKCAGFCKEEMSWPKEYGFYNKETFFKVK